MADNPVIEWLAELDGSALAIAGGKGANLGELTQHDLPVPSGFVITTDGYRQFVEANGLGERILELASRPSADDPSTSEAVASQLREIFTAAPMPGALADAVRAAFAGLPGNAAVAVRSSATAEDLPSASFAGQQETVLNVRGEEALLHAVRQCWASLWTARAMAYRAQQAIAPDAVAMAVVVQQMVHADVAGVLFTANPNTGARDEVLVEASFGLGEAVVAGAVTPDTFVLDRESLSVEATRLGTKETMIVGSEDGETTRSQPVPAARRREAALPESLLIELAALGLLVEQHCNGTPQDIDWAVADGRIWLLQARPITDLPVAPLRNVRWEPPVPDTVWMRRQIVEHMPEPLSPLFAELYLEDGLAQSVEKLGDFMGAGGALGRIMEQYMPYGFARTVNGYGYTIGSVDFTWDLLGTTLRIYATILPRLLREGYAYWRDEGVTSYRRLIERWQRVELHDASDETLLAGVRELAAGDAIYWFAAAIPLALSRLTDSLLDAFMKRVTDGDNPAADTIAASSAPYLRGFPTKAMEAQAELEDIAARIREHEPLRKLVAGAPPEHLLDRLAAHADGSPAADALRGHLDHYGHRIYNLDFVAPTLAEEPLPVLLSLKRAVEQPDRDARAQQQELARKRDQLVDDTAQSLTPLQRPVYRLLLGWAQRATPYRDEALFHVGAAWPTLRALALELGARLAESGSLREPDDVFFLGGAELEAAMAARAEGTGRPGLAQLALLRRNLREARKRLTPPLSVPPNATLEVGPIRLKMFEPQPDVADADGATLSGYPVSPGTVTAAASVIGSPDEFDQMQPDTILVCPTTAPAWTPLFSQAVGLVTDIGGALAHGSIVAREYGIPAVMGTGNATKRIERNQLIRVDGTAGTITLVSQADAGSPPAPAAASQRSSAGPGSVLPVVAVAALIGVVSWWRRRGTSAPAGCDDITPS
jgi:phosphohistidine swiveling domain-containing protein